LQYNRIDGERERERERYLVSIQCLRIILTMLAL